MSSNNKNKWSNLIIASSLVLLLGTSIVAIQRAQDQRAYEALSEQRAEQSEDQKLTESSRMSAERSDYTQNEGSKAVQTALVKTGNNPEAPSPAFTYKENDNKEWLSINPDFMGWLQIPGSDIDYPFVRGQDNTHYLKRDFYGKYSESGSVFMDYRNLGNFNDQHSLVYGHNMKNKTMFYDLIKYKDAEFLAENPLVNLSGLYETKTYKIFSVYEISADDYEFTLEFENDSAYLNYLKELEALSLHPQNNELTSRQKLLSLVTCSYGDNSRIIVHAIEMNSDIVDRSISTAAN